MKKVRRRVVERDPADDNQESTETQNNPLLAFEGARIENSSEIPQRLQQHNQQKVTQRITHGKRSEIWMPPAENQSQAKDMSTHLPFKNKDETSISPNPQLKSSDQPIIAQPAHQADNNKQPQVKSEEDEKKRRIEMLKQKYLKKAPQAKIQMPKPAQVLKEPIVQKPKVVIPPFQEPKTENTIEVKTNTQVKQQQKSIKIPPPPPPTIVTVQVIQTEPQKIQSFTPEPVIEKSKQVQQQSSNITPCEKLQDKKPFKIPPPPPQHSKVNHPRSKLPPPPVVKVQEHQQQQVFVKDSWMQNKTQLLETTSANASRQAEPVKSTFVPPPPPSASAKTAKTAPKSPLVQEILSKKLKKDEEKLRQQEQANRQTKYQQPATSEIKASLQSEPQQVRNVPTRQFKIQRQALKNQQQASSAKMLSLSESIDRWINLPSSMLSKFIPNIDGVLHSSFDRSDKDFAFYSKNQTFNSSINSFINQFVLKNKNGLSEGQRTSLYTLSLEYFNSNPSQLSAQLLLILIKLGNQYLEKHAQHLVSNLEENSSIILSNKPYFTNEELSTLSSFIIDQKQLNETQILYLLLIYPSEKLINIINAKNINNVQFIITLLSCLQLIRKQFPILMGVYLKLISSLIENIPDDHNLIEVVLKHVNELQTNQKSYQLHKQIKLKLISMLSSSQNQRQEVRNQTAEVSKDSGDGGLLGYWSKAVDKIKTVTTQIADTKNIEKPKPVEQSEEKEDDITYDPILKRYLINGKVPEDDSSRPADPTASKLPPPPPPPKNTNKPVPPPLPGKKARVATNRYA